MEEIRNKARAIVQSAQGKLVYYFGARHFAPELDEGIAKICQEEGFIGCSTDIGAKAWNYTSKSPPTLKPNTNNEQI
jgi:nicotinic acid phosphoribosyltransferase